MVDLKAWCVLVIVALTSDAQQLKGPIIISPKEIKLEKGQNYTIHCKGNRPLQFKQQEMAEEIMGNFSKTQRNVAPSDNEYGYEIALDLFNVDHFAVGYYACHDDLVDASAALRDLVDEPFDTDHVSYTYVYVNDSELIVPMREIVFVKPGSKIVIECKPTYPDIEVNLTMDSTVIEYERYNPKIGFTLDSDDIFDMPVVVYSCDFSRKGARSNKILFFHQSKVDPNQPKPKIDKRQTHYFLKNETIFLNCTVPYKSNTAIVLEWTIPRGSFDQVDITSNENETISDYGYLYRAIWVKNTTEADEGYYNCTAKTKNNKSSITNVKLLYTATPLLELANGATYIAKDRNFSCLFRINLAHPFPQYKFYKDDHIPISNGNKYVVTKTDNGVPKLIILNVNIEDTGNYTLEATNANGTKTLTHSIYVEDGPKIQFDMSNDRKLVGSVVKLKCTVTGYPLPNVTWTFIDDETNKENSDSGIQVKSTYKVVTTLDMLVSMSGKIICSASNTAKKTFVSRNVTKKFLVDEIAGGFGVENGEKEIKTVSENQFVKLRCLASIYDYTFVSWLGPNDTELPPNMVQSFNNSISLIAMLQIDQISLSQAGNYTCVASNQTDTYERRETVQIKVEAIRPPTIKVPDLDTETKEVMFGRPVALVCVAEAVPPPEIKWLKDNVLIKDNIFMSSLNFTTVKSVHNFTKQNDTTDKYECVATSGNLERRKTFYINLQAPPAKSPFKLAYLSIILAIFIVLILLVAYLTWKIKKEKQFRKELNAAGLLYFKEGAVRSLNPNLPIDEQADLLPYNDKFEFPADKLILGPQLGAGAFGVVYKAEARGIVNAEDSTTVAVKMVKKTADNIYIKALASELKIMANLGKHVNIVNLLGACTKNVAKRELIVIVEFCKFGNIHNYMQRHREVFIDTLTDNKDKNQGNVNRAFSCSSGNSGMNSDCFNSNQTQQTDHTFLNTAASNRSGRLDKSKLKSDSEKVSESGYVQPEWRSNYESDYVYDGRKPRPLYSRDLLAWAFQIARGMEYLASRKILHGDLAARNILLAEDNVVKICDFGLARSIYKNDEYQKKENSPLPVKWLAIECITDRIFSTQSDVWSFGIVLWELFSLAKTPYPEISPQNLLPRLLAGHRLDKPMYADDRLYKVMQACWEQRPPKRPTFTELQNTLGSFLEDNVRDHYVELNTLCESMNADITGEDYLLRVCAPDYNNQVTPSPHHYANDVSGFFFGTTPNKLQNDVTDDEGYLAMTPAAASVRSPRHGAAFDFEARKLNSRSSAASQGSELTPMLTLSHIPRSGSESDHEGATSPYLNMQPRIDEETDEVFEIDIKNNLKNSQNAVTNPTYITVPLYEKKSPITANSYVNVNGNGIVK